MLQWKLEVKTGIFRMLLATLRNLFLKVLKAEFHTKECSRIFCFRLLVDYVVAWVTVVVRQFLNCKLIQSLSELLVPVYVKVILMMFILQRKHLIMESRANL